MISILVNLIGEIFCFFLLCIICGYIIGKLFTCRIYFIYHQRLNFEFSLYRNIIHSSTPEVSPLLLFGIESLFHPKTVCYIMNEFLYFWRLTISSSSWTTMFSCITCNILWKFSWSSEKEAKVMNLFINQEKTKYMPVT